MSDIITRIDTCHGWISLSKRARNSMPWIVQPQGCLEDSTSLLISSHDHAVLKDASYHRPFCCQ